MMGLGVETGVQHLPVKSRHSFQVKIEFPVQFNTTALGTV